MSEGIRCPECGSTDWSCIETLSSTERVYLFTASDAEPMMAQDTKVLGEDVIDAEPWECSNGHPISDTGDVWERIEKFRQGERT